MHNNLRRKQFAHMVMRSGCKKHNTLLRKIGVDCFGAPIFRSRLLGSGGIDKVFAPDVEFGHFRFEGGRLNF
jgi:hypothetical protein